MSVLAKKQLNFFEVIKKATRSFVFSLFYPATICLLTFLFWALDYQDVGVAFCCLFGVFTLVFFDDLTPSLPAFFSLPMVFRDATKLSDSTSSIIFMSILAVALIANLIIYPIKKVKLDTTFLAIVCIGLVFLLSEICSPYFNEFENGLQLLAVCCFSPLIIHFFILNRAKEQKSIDSTCYFCYSFLFSIATACLQMVYAFAVNLLAEKRSFGVPGGFCWANTNHIANLILIAVPVCYYLMCREKNIFPLIILTALFYVCSFISNSDGGLGTLIIFTPALIIKTQFTIKKRNRKIFTWFWITAIILCVIAVLYSAIFQKSLLKEFFEKLLNDNNRSSLFSIAWNEFLARPILGGGLGHAVVTVGIRMKGFYHSTFFQAIGSAGILGVLSYAFLYYARIKSLKQNGRIFSSFMIYATIMFLCYGLIENSEFNIVVIFYTAIFSFSLTQTEKAENILSLPVHKKFSLFS